MVVPRPLAADLPAADLSTDSSPVRTHRPRNVPEPTARELAARLIGESRRCGSAQSGPVRLHRFDHRADGEITYVVEDLVSDHTAVCDSATQVVAAVERVIG